jgi:hypothetical protein
LFGGREFGVEGDTAFLSFLALVAKVALCHDAVAGGVVALPGLTRAASFATLCESCLRRRVERKSDLVVLELWFCGDVLHRGHVCGRRETRGRRLVVSFAFLLNLQQVQTLCFRWAKGVKTVRHFFSPLSPLLSGCFVTLSFLCSCAVVVCGLCFSLRVRGRVFLRPCLQGAMVGVYFFGCVCVCVVLCWVVPRSCRV